jgi:hypothetical protein
VKPWNAWNAMVNLIQKKQRDLLELVEDAGYKRANAPL